MTEAGATAVKTGIWTDYSRGKILGSILTLPNRHATVLLALMATLVGIAGTRSWMLTRFFLYKAFPTEENTHEDEPTDQPAARTFPQHVILRNSETASGAALTLIEYACFGRKPTGAKSKQRLRDTLVTIAAILHAALFIACSILTSQIFLGRLVVSDITDTCGWWIVNGTGGDPTSPRALILSELRLNNTLETDNYVQNCYSSNSSSEILDCGKLVTAYLPFSVEHNVSCPFAPEVCYGENTGFALDSGKISVSQLGINSRSNDNLSIRRRSVCAPLRQGPFHQATWTSANLSLLEGEDDIIGQYWFYSENGEQRFHFARDSHLKAYYELSAYHIPDAGLTPSPPLELTDKLPDGAHGPSVILLTGTGVLFNKPYDDMVWSVHREVGVHPDAARFGIDTSQATVRYMMDRLINIIGCDERLQICSTATGRCSPWTGLYFLPDLTELTGVSADEDPEMDLELTAVATLISTFAPHTSIPESIAGRDGASALRASRYMSNGVHFYLEPEQWKTELKHWFSMALARFQLELFQSIEKPPQLDTTRLQNMWAGTAATWLCGRIKYHSAGHMSLSFFGIMTAVVVSVLLIVLSFFEVIFSKPIGKWWPGYRHWQGSENLALLRHREDSDKPAATPNGQTVSGVAIAAPPVAVEDSPEDVPARTPQNRPETPA
jgi:hypothetical protein